MTEPSKQSQTNDLSRAAVNTVQAESVDMEQSAAQSIDAGDVSMNQSAAAQVQSLRVTSNLSALALVQSDNVDMQNSGAALIRSRDLFLNGYAGAVVARNAELNQSRVGVLAAGQVRSDKIESVILISRKVEGNVTTLVDTRGALIAGLVGGLFTGLILLLGRRLISRN